MLDLYTKAILGGRLRSKVKRGVKLFLQFLRQHECSSLKYPIALSATSRRAEHRGVKFLFDVFSPEHFRNLSSSERRSVARALSVCFQGGINFLGGVRLIKR